jgi:flagellar basal body-associated protein FliL
MQTKILIIVGVSVASVLALFVMGFFLDKDAAKKEKSAEKKENTNPPSQPDQV